MWSRLDITIHHNHYPKAEGIREQTAVCVVGLDFDQEETEIVPLLYRDLLTRGSKIEEFKIISNVRK